ncbi:DNA phosphorothioation-dependent restriction protein DptG [Fredinandcohnia onubensis]|uniref:DNA phosphorothioation-dependent restriction protein DptG n=1 Tax=Fredinandcohnia onubensis TaxID=1571209 RepID=UPI0015D4F30E|nr:DNA phosphorothioation-dependent restriction protein DptG [Fredinandcohnia onubensis]
MLIEDLEKLIKEKKNRDGVIHDTGNIESILPFNSSRKTTVIRDRFQKVLGEFTRQISDLKLDKQKDSDELEYEEADPLVSRISEKVECENDDIRLDLNHFLQSHLFGQDGDIKSIHPYIFNYYPLSNEKKKALRNEEIRIAKFSFDILVDESTKFQDVFLNKAGEDILTTLVLDNLGSLQKQNNNSTKSFRPLLKVVSDLFKEDFIYISKYRDYFLEHYPDLVQFYYFLYLSQITLKFSKFDSADYSKVEPLYFALDWESLNKRRNAASVGGYKSLKERTKDLFVHIHTLSQLSHNTKNEDGERFFTYNELNEFLQDDKDCQEFIQSINQWVHKYHERAHLKFEINEKNTLSEAFEQLFHCLEEGMSTQVVKKYGEAVEDAAIGKFLKARGNLGYTLNLTQDFVLLLTAVSVKDDRIPLKKLFEEFEKRGVALDRYSVKEVTELLDNLNIIEKKSDSGDAQYVKPIL